MTSDTSSLWRRADFLRLWGAQSVSEMGSQVTVLVLPLLAVVVLQADTFQVGALSAATNAAFLLVSLQAGALVDRWRRRAVMVTADLARAALLATIPAAWFLGSLGLVQLYVVAALVSVLTVFFDVAYQSYLPTLLSDRELTDGNARLAGTQSLAQVCGPGLGGLLVAAVGAAATLILDVVSYLASAVLLIRIREEEPPPPPRDETATLRTEIREGLAFVLGHPVLRMIVACTATVNFFSSASTALLVAFLVRDLGASEAVVGVVLAVGACGGLAGAALTGRLARVFGSARVMWLVLLVQAPFLFLVPLAPAGWGVVLVAVAGAVTEFAVVVYNVTQISYRQAVTSDRLLGRMNASVRFVVWGVMPLGALAGGALGSATGLRGVLLLAAAGEALAVLWLLASPLQGMREMPETRSET